MDFYTQQSLGNNLKLLRHAYGYTQEQLSEELHICRTTYILYEQGKKLPSVDFLVDLARFYQIRLEVLFDTRTGFHVQSLFSDERSKREAKHLVEVYYLLPPHVQGRLIERADSLLEGTYVSTQNKK